MEKIDDGLKALLESGKEKGFLTYDQVNDYLPDDDTNPEKIDQILILLEDQGIELIEEAEAEERENPELGQYVLKMQEAGRHCPDRVGWLQQILDRFRERRLRPTREDLQQRLYAASDHATALELLRRLQDRNLDLGP